jgi:hypothetical protein
MSLSCGAYVPRFSTGALCPWARSTTNSKDNSLPSHQFNEDQPTIWNCHSENFPTCVWMIPCDPTGVSKGV